MSAYLRDRDLCVALGEENRTANPPNSRRVIWFFSASSIIRWASLTMSVAGVEFDTNESQEDAYAAESQYKAFHTVPPHPFNIGM